MAYAFKYALPHMAGRVPSRRSQIGLQNAKIGRKARGDRLSRSAHRKRDTSAEYCNDIIMIIMCTLYRNIKLLLYYVFSLYITPFYYSSIILS